MKRFSLDKNFGVNTLSSRLELYMAITEGIFTLKDIGIHKRVINHWASQDLLLNEKEESKWRKFSFIDYVWLSIVKELREVGLPLEIIKTLKEELFKITPDKQVYQQLKDNPEKLNNIPNEKERREIKKFLHSREFEEMDAESGMPEFFNLIVHTILSKETISIILFKDGKFLPLYENNYQYYKKETLEKIIFETHITVSISKIIKEFLVSDHSMFVLPQLKILGLNELKLLEIINSGEYEAVTINFKNKKMKSLQMIKEQDVKKRIVDILTENAYQDIVIKSHGGIITHIQNTHKVIFE